MKEEIDSLLARVRANQIGMTEPWGGADVVITRSAPEPSEGNFYPDPRYVETPFVRELSWLFEQLRDIFWKVDGYGFWKEEFFGRLGNLAVKFQSVCPDCTVSELLQAVIDEAMTMADEIEQFGGLDSLMLTTGNMILDDITLVSDNNRYLTRERVQERLRMYVGDEAVGDQAGDTR